MAPVYTSTKGTGLGRRCRTRTSCAVALFSKKVEKKAAPPPPKKRGLFGRPTTTTTSSPDTFNPRKPSSSTPKQSFLSGVVEALDFAEARSPDDKALLQRAKGNWIAGKSKLTREEAAALRRKVGGTARDYWKDWVEVEGDYVDTGYVAESDGVAYLPVLGAVVVGIIAATVAVVANT